MLEIENARAGSPRRVATAAAGLHPAVIVEVAGEAFYTGEATFAREPEDPLGMGFLLRR